MKTVDDRAVNIAVTNHLVAECTSADECRCEIVECIICCVRVDACHAFTIDQYLPTGTLIGRTWFCLSNECTDALNNKLSDLFHYSTPQRILEEVTAL